jgi:integrase/recombinase XerC
MSGVAGLTFDDGDTVSPTTGLLAPFADWATVLAGRRSPATTRGYITDVGILTTALHPPGTPEHDTDPTRYPLPTTLQHATPTIPAEVWARAAASVDGLVLADLHPRRLARALDDLSARRAPATQRRMASAMSSFTTHLVRRGLLAANPMDHDAVLRPARPDANPVPLERDDVARLLACVLTPDPGTRNPWPTRDFALLAMLLGTGLRNAEVCTLQVGNLSTDSDTPRIRALGKGAKRRTVPLHPATVAALDAYRGERTTRLGAPTRLDPLFVRVGGTAFTTRGLRHLVDRWYTRAGVLRTPGACVHALRHTFATDALDSGASVIELSTLLGHASLESSRHYLAVVGSGLADTIAAHPAGALTAAAQRTTRS